MKGFGAAETSQAFDRALALCRTIEDSPQTITVINGIIGVHLMREEYERARTLAKGLLVRRGRPDEAMQLLIGHRTSGMSLFYMGELSAACDHLHAAIALYDANPQGPLPMVFSQDQKATAQAYLALASVLLGDIGGGLALGHAAVAYAEKLRHPHSLAYVLAERQGAWLWQLRAANALAALWYAQGNRMQARRTLPLSVTRLTKIAGTDLERAKALLAASG